MAVLWYTCRWRVNNLQVFDVRTDWCSFFHIFTDYNVNVRYSYVAFWCLIKLYVNISPPEKEEWLLCSGIIIFQGGVAARLIPYAIPLRGCLSMNQFSQDESSFL